MADNRVSLSQDMFAGHPMGQNKHSRLAYSLGMQEVLDINSDFEGSEHGPKVNSGTVEGPRGPQSWVLGQWEASADGAIRATSWPFIIVPGFKKSTRGGCAGMVLCAVLCNRLKGLSQD